MGDGVGIRELKDHLSSVLRRVKRGETVTITERRRPVAILIPAATVESERILERLAKTGRLSWSGGKPAGCKKPPRVRGASVSDAILEDRR